MNKRQILNLEFSYATSHLLPELYYLATQLKVIFANKLVKTVLLEIYLKSFSNKLPFITSGCVQFDDLFEKQNQTGCFQPLPDGSMCPATYSLGVTAGSLVGDAGCTGAPSWKATFTDCSLVMQSANLVVCSVN